MSASDLCSGEGDTIIKKEVDHSRQKFEASAGDPVETTSQLDLAGIDVEEAHSSGDVSIDDQTEEKTNDQTEEKTEDAVSFPSESELKQTEQLLMDRMKNFRETIDTLKNEIATEKQHTQVTDTKQELITTQVYEKFLSLDTSLMSDLEELTYTQRNLDLQSIRSISNHMNTNDSLGCFLPSPYSEGVLLNQSAKRNAIKKHTMLNSYRQQLSDIESKCNLELFRLKQSMQCLEPMQTMLQQWSLNGDDELTNTLPDIASKSTADILERFSDKIKNDLTEQQSFGQFE